MPATTAVMKLMTGRTIAAATPKKAFVTRIESAPVSGAVIRKDMHAEREAPFLRISATTGTTEQLQSGTAHRWPRWWRPTSGCRGEASEGSPRGK